MKTAAIILAAGRSSRFGDGHKLLADFQGVPMIAHVIGLARKARLDEIILVTGHQSEAVMAAAGPGLRAVLNPDFAMGIASSIKVGLTAVSEEMDSAFIMLGDMPLVHEDTMAAMLAKADHASLYQAVIPVQGGRRGNPVLVRRGLFPLLDRLEGDQGARKMLESADVCVLECPVDDEGIHADFDTRDAFSAHAFSVQ